ncbi:MAG TPA: KTSC domain-containing protein [Pseudolysinimonas sp.]
MTSMRRTPVRSSVIASVGYDADTAVLEVEFRSGDLYRYFAVPPSVHRALLEADSPGAYFNRNISDKYPTRQQY